MRRAGEWALRVLLALAFVAAGLDKFLGAMWVRVFNDIGFGQWFRYFTVVASPTLIPKPYRIDGNRDSSALMAS